MMKNALEITLKGLIKEQWAANFDAIRWKKKAFKRYTDDQAIARRLVLGAATTVARNFNLVLDSNQKAVVRSFVTLDATPESLVPKILGAFHRGVQCPPGTTPVLVAKPQPDGSVVYEWDCQ